MAEIRYVTEEDREFWYRLDGHLPEKEFEKKGMIMIKAI